MSQTIRQARAYHARPQPRLSDDPAEHFRLVEEALDRVRRSKDGLDSYGRHKPSPPLQLGEPTAERSRKAVAVSKGSMAPPGAPKVIRSVIDAPITLSATRALLLAENFAQIEAGKDALRNILTPLDKAAEIAEQQALERFWAGSIASEGKAAITNYSGASHGSDKEKIPFTDRNQREISARHYAYARLPPAFQVKIDFFCALMSGQSVMVKERVAEKQKGKTKGEPPKIVERERPLSLIDLGKHVAKTTDDRVAKGAYIATFRCIAQLLCTLYSDWEVHDARRRQQIEDDVKKRKRTASGSLSTTCG